MRSDFDELSPTSSQLSDDDIFDMDREIEYDTNMVNEYNTNMDTNNTIEQENTLLNDQMIDLVLDYVSYKIGESSNVTGIEKIDLTIQNCRNSGFKRTGILSYLVNSGYIDLNENSENNETIEDSLSYIQSMLQHKTKYVSNNFEEISLVVSSVSKLFVLELMANVNRQMLKDQSNKKVITIQNIYDAFISQKSLIPDL